MAEVRDFTHMYTYAKDPSLFVPPRHPLTNIHTIYRARQRESLKISWKSRRLPVDRSVNMCHVISMRSLPSLKIICVTHVLISLFDIEEFFEERIKYIFPSIINCNVYLTYKELYLYIHSLLIIYDTFLVF